MQITLLSLEECDVCCVVSRGKQKLHLQQKCVDTTLKSLKCIFLLAKDVALVTHFDGKVGVFTEHSMKHSVLQL